MNSSKSKIPCFCSRCTDEAWLGELQALVEESTQLCKKVEDAIAGMSYHLAYSEAMLNHLPPPPIPAHWKNNPFDDDDDEDDAYWLDQVEHLKHILVILEGRRKATKQRHSELLAKLEHPFD